MPRLLTILLVFAVAAWGALGVLGNVIDWNNAATQVASVVSMSSFPGGSASWRATSSPAVVLLGTVYIILFKVIATLLCLIGTARMWAARQADAATFAAAKSAALAGCAVVVLGLFVGWVVIGEGWFQLWRSPTLREAAGETALRYGAFVALIALLVGMREQ